MAGQDAAAAHPPPRLRWWRRLGRSETATGWLLVSPGAILIGIFGLLPVLMSLQLSFQKSDLLTPDTPWVGTKNYRELAHELTIRTRLTSPLEAVR